MKGENCLYSALSSVSADPVAMWSTDRVVLYAAWWSSREIMQKRCWAENLLPVQVPVI